MTATKSGVKRADLSVELRLAAVLSITNPVAKFNRMECEALMGFRPTQSSEVATGPAGANPDGQCLDWVRIRKDSRDCSIGLADRFAVGKAFGMEPLASPMATCALRAGRACWPMRN